MLVALQAWHRHAWELFGFLAGLVALQGICHGLSGTKSNRWCTKMHYMTNNKTIFHSCTIRTTTVRADDVQLVLATVAASKVRAPARIWIGRYLCVPSEVALCHDEPVLIA
jgi:hypothetical protein